MTRRVHALFAGALVLLAVLGFGATATATASASKSFAASTITPTAPSVETPQELYCGINDRPATYHGTNAKRKLARVKLDPLKVVNYPCGFPSTVRGIRLNLNSIGLVAAGQLVRTIPLPGPGPITLPSLTQLINDPTWVAQSAPGVFELKASLVQEAGTTLDVEAPAVTVLKIDGEDANSVSGSHATATFNGVTVESWDPATNEPVTTPKSGRPFILYENASQMNILDSTMQYLGSDVTSSYGVSWRVGGSSGLVDDSLFQHNFFGAYTYQAAHVIFENSTFRYNTFYGLDPHTYSTELTITGNDVYGNADHGIIFSRYVTNSVVSKNYVHGNKVNGIMMDFNSNHDVIADNVVTGNDEGIVMSGSAQDDVYGNTVTDNRVGIRASHYGANLDGIHNNQITGGSIGIQLYGGAAGTQVTGNVIKGPSSTGMVLDALGALVSDNRVSGTPTGIEVQTAATLIGGSLQAHNGGIEVGPEGFATVRAVAVDAPTPVSRSAGSIVILTDTTFHLPHTGSSVSGFEIAGILFLSFAVLCEVLYLLRGRSVKRFALNFQGMSPGGTLVEHRLPHLTRLSVQVHRPSSERPHRKFKRALVTGVALSCTCLIVALVIGSARAGTATPEEPFTTPELSAAISQAFHGAASPLTAALDAAVDLTSLPPTVTPPLSEVPSNFPASTLSCEVSDTASQPNLPCDQFGDPNGKTQVMLVGDSHAAMWLPAVNELAVQNGWKLTFLAKTGCPIGDYPNFVLSGYADRPYTECNSWRSAVIARIAVVKPAVVIVASEARSIAAQEPKGLTQSLQAMRKSAGTVIFLADTPNPTVEVPDCLAQHRADVSACNLPLASSGIESAGRMAEIAGAQAAGAAVIDPAPWFCVATVCPVVVQDTIVYMDSSHITSNYALLREPQLATAVDTALKEH